MSPLVPLLVVALLMVILHGLAFGVGGRWLAWSDFIVWAGIVVLAIVFVRA